MRRFLLLSLLISLSVMFGCQKSHIELTSQQKQLAADLESITDDYLVLNIERPGFGGKVFCTHKTLDVEDKGKSLSEYVFAICQEYNAGNQKLSEGTGTGIPVALEIERQGQTYQVVSHKVPGDSPRFAEDVKRIFPEKTHDEIFYGDRNDLIAAVEKKAKAYYGIQ